VDIVIWDREVVFAVEELVFAEVFEIIVVEFVFPIRLLIVFL
jgi:hypothetical protein